MLKIAVLHHDQAVADSLAKWAGDLGLQITRADSVSELEALLSRGDIRAVVLDVAGPLGGGFELVERVCASTSAPAAVVVTELDAKTVQSTRRLAESKSLDVSFCRKSAFTRDLLREALAAPETASDELAADSLQDSIERNFLRVHYQPKVPFRPGEGAPGYAVEALVRLRHPELGDVYPDQFISVAEKSGLIQQLTDAVTRQAFADLSAWRAAGLKVKMALNISPLLLSNGVWSSVFLERCEEFGVSPEEVTLEITESSMGAENTAALDVLTRLRLKGFTLSIDDFGTGFSSLAVLYKLPFSELKLDKSFVMDMFASDEARTLIETTIAMARRIGLGVVAEGVETKEAFAELRGFGCDLAQGYFVSRPLTADRIPAFFEEWDKRPPVPDAADETAPAVTFDAGEDLTEDATLPADRSKLGVIHALLGEIMNAGRGEGDATLVLDEDDSEAPFAADGEASPVHDVVRKIPALAMQGKNLEALAACHEARLCLEDSEDGEDAVRKLGELESVLNRELLSAGPMTLDLGEEGTVGLIAGKPALIGRGVAAGAVDIATSCRWFSRGERNLSLYRRDGEWLIEDLGSTNGNSLNGRLLAVGAPVSLPDGDSTVTIGRDAASRPPVSVHISRFDGDPAAVLVRFAVDEDKIDSAADEIRWSGWRQEIRRRWLVLSGGRATIGSDPDCALRDPRASSDKVAEISYDGGYWICPPSGAPVVIDGQAFHRRAPLPAGANVSAGGVQFSTRLEDGAPGSDSTRPRFPVATAG